MTTVYQNEPSEDSLTLGKTSKQINSLSSMLRTNINILSSEIAVLSSQIAVIREDIKDCNEKLKIYSSPPYLVSTVIEVLENTCPSRNENESKGIVIKTSTRQTVLVPVEGMVNFSDLSPGDLIGVNKDTYIPLSILPNEYNFAAKFSIVDPSSTSNTLEDFSDIGGISKQIEELREAIVLPLNHSDRLRGLGVTPGKGVLLYGVPGTGKTLLARAIAKELKATFFKIAAPVLAQGFVGAGAALVREIFRLAREKEPSIIFIDEIDAIGTKRTSEDESGSREITRTMLELLNCMDGFNQDDKIKVIAATNRADILDPALVRSGRLDRKIKFELPNEIEREEILEIHSRGMVIDDDINLMEISRACDGFNGAMLKAVCVEAGMIAVKNNRDKILQIDLVDGVQEVREKKFKRLDYFS